jgi:putative oxidoreductase
MLQSFAMRTLLPLILRATLAVVFIYHGLEKVTPDNGFGAKWMPAAADGNSGLPHAIQIAVAWGELMGGVAIALGLLTRIAALGIIAIMAGAIVTVTGPAGFSLLNKGFEYNYVLIMVALALIITGAGTLSLDQVIRVKMRGPAKY